MDNYLFHEGGTATFPDGAIRTVKTAWLIPNQDVELMCFMLKDEPDKLYKVVVKGDWEDENILQLIKPSAQIGLFACKENGWVGCYIQEHIIFSFYPKEAV